MMINKILLLSYDISSVQTSPQKPGISLEQITGKNEKEKLNVPRFPHLHILQSKNFKFPAFFDELVKKGLLFASTGV